MRTRDQHFHLKAERPADAAKRLPAATPQPFDDPVVEPETLIVRLDRDLASSGRTLLEHAYAVSRGRRGKTERGNGD